MKIRVHSEDESRPMGLKIKKTSIRSLAIVAVALSIIGSIANSLTMVEDESLAIYDGKISLTDTIVINPDYEQYLEDVKAGKGGEYEIIPNKYIPATNGAKRQPMSRGNGDTNLPSSYNLVEEGFGTTIKNQAADGICWSYSITSAVESYLKKNNNLSIEFSPKQLDYLYAVGTPHANMIASRFGEEVTHQLGDGYNFILASMGFSSGLAPVKEAPFFAKMQANDPNLAQFESWAQYSDVADINMQLGAEINPYTVPMTYDKVTSVPNEYVITEYEDYGFAAADLSAIKSNIYNNGAVYVGTIAPGVENCYDEESKTIVDRGSTVCGNTNGHAMLVVGWDDNYTYVSPADGSTKTGAFILQNSYGTDDLFERYGITYDYLVEEGIIDPSELSQAEIDNIHDYIENYDAWTFVHLAYEYATTNPISDFGLIKKVEQNNYDGIYSASNGQGYTNVAVTGEEANELTYTFNTGNRAETIDSIGVSMSAIAVPFAIHYDISIDNGAGFVVVGELETPANSYAVQKNITFQIPVNVEGTFKVKLTATSGSDVVALTGAEEYFDVTVFVKEATGGDEEEEIVVPNTGAPNTGANMKTDKNMTSVIAIALPIVGSTTLAAWIVIAIVKKHKVSFERH